MGGALYEEPGTAAVTATQAVFHDSLRPVAADPAGGGCVTAAGSLAASGGGTSGYLSDRSASRSDPHRVTRPERVTVNDEAASGVHLACIRWHSLARLGLVIA
jgi:hypothetical protein